MVYKRRSKAEIANGIGSWLDILSVITKIAVIVNMGTLFFTSSKLQTLFVGFDSELILNELKQYLNSNPGAPLSSDLE